MEPTKNTSSREKIKKAFRTGVRGQPWQSASRFGVRRQVAAFRLRDIGLPGPGSRSSKARTCPRTPKSAFTEGLRAPLPWGELAFDCGQLLFSSVFEKTIDSFVTHAGRSHSLAFPLYRKSER